MSQLYFFPLYVSKYEARTTHLTILEDGAYMRLLRLCWATPGCSIPADEAWIMRKMRARSKAERAAIEQVLEEFFRLENGRYSNPKLAEIFAEAEATHKKRSNAGAKGGKSKSLKTNNSPPSRAKAGLKQPYPEPEYTPLTPQGGLRRVSRRAGVSEAVIRIAEEKG